MLSKQFLSSMCRVNERREEKYTMCHTTHNSKNVNGQIAVVEGGEGAVNATRSLLGQQGDGGGVGRLNHKNEMP